MVRLGQVLAATLIVCGLALGLSLLLTSPLREFLVPDSAAEADARIGETPEWLIERPSAFSELDDANGLRVVDTLLFSPHFDDVVFSASAELCSIGPSARVVTVFGGKPRHEHVTDWDKQCGFNGSSTAYAARTIEDSMALGVMGAVRETWPFLDSQYRQVEGTEDFSREDTTLLEICERVRKHVMHFGAKAQARGRVLRVLAPSLRKHIDHSLLHTAMVAVMREWLGAGEHRPPVTWAMYEDWPYAKNMGDGVHEEIERGDHCTYKAVNNPIDSRCWEKKLRAIEQYHSQSWLFNDRAKDRNKQRCDGKTVPKGTVACEVYNEVEKCRLDS